MEHAQEILPQLWIVTLAVLSALVALVTWIGKRLQENVDMLPRIVSEKVKEVHDEVVGKVDEIGGTLRDLERDLRNNQISLDRRVYAVEIRCDLMHSAPHVTGSPVNGNRHS